MHTFAWRISRPVPLGGDPDYGVDPVWIQVGDCFTLRSRSSVLICFLTIVCWKAGLTFPSIKAGHLPSEEIMMPQNSLVLAKHNCKLAVVFLKNTNHTLEIS